MTAPVSKRELQQQARRDEVEKRLRSGSSDGGALDSTDAMEATPSSPAPPAVTPPSDAPSPTNVPSQVSPSAGDAAASRAQGAGVSKIVSNLRGGVVGQLEEKTAQLEAAQVELEELRPLKALADGRALPVISIDPKLVMPTRFLNRDPKSMDAKADRDFRALVADVEQKRTNEIPGFIRPLHEPVGEYTHEAVYGNRRLKACLLAGVSFKAIVADIDDEQAILLQRTENSLRKKLSAIESGRQIHSYLQKFRNAQGRLPDGALQLLASALKSDPKHVQKLALIGTIPEAVLKVIPDIRDIPYRPAYLLARECRDDVAAVERRMKSIPEGANSRKVVTCLLGKDGSFTKVAAGKYALELPGDPDVREAVIGSLKEIEERFGIRLGFKEIPQ